MPQSGIHAHRSPVQGGSGPDGGAAMVRWLISARPTRLSSVWVWRKAAPVQSQVRRQVRRQAER